MSALSELPSGSQIFIDANIFVYHTGRCLGQQKDKRVLWASYE